MIKGNTYRMEAEFMDWDNGNLLTDPAVVKFKILDLQFNMTEEFILGAQNRQALGKYAFFYTPKKTGVFFYEWYADIDGLPSLMRESFTVTNS